MTDSEFWGYSPFSEGYAHFIHGDAQLLLERSMLRLDTDNPIRLVLRVHGSKLTRSKLRIFTHERNGWRAFFSVMRRSIYYDKLDTVLFYATREQGERRAGEAQDAY